MKTSLYLSGLAVALLGLGAAHGQELPYSSLTAPNRPLGSGAMPGLAGMPVTNSPQSEANGDENGRSTDERSTPGKSSWLTYPRPAHCCGPVGGHGPIGAELYARTGVSFPFGGFLASQLKPGWVIEGGLRTLFFNPARDAAWVIDTGISNVNYNSTTRDTAILQNFQLNILGQSFTIPEFPVTPGGLNQTFVNLSVGRELYLWGDASCAEKAPTCRLGWDLGGRWGSSKLVLREIRHRTDVCGGMFAALHTDLEVPYSCCIFQFGFRAEYGYIWSDILQRQNDADLNTINLMVTAGVRY